MDWRDISLAATCACIDVALLISCVLAPHRIILVTIDTTNATIARQAAENAAYHSSRNLSVGERDVIFFARTACIEKEIAYYGAGMSPHAPFRPEWMIPFLNRTSERFAPQMDCKRPHIDLFRQLDTGTLFFRYIRWLSGCSLAHALHKIKFVVSENPIMSYKSQIASWMTTNSIVPMPQEFFMCLDKGDTVLAHFYTMHLLMQGLGLA